jgi:hypothetical protein
MEACEIYSDGLEFWDYAPPSGFLKMVLGFRPPASENDRPLPCNTLEASCELVGGGSPTGLVIVFATR